MTKLCAKCKVIKPHSEFARNAVKRDGLQTYCKGCKRAVDQLYYQNNVDKVTARASAPAARRRQRATKYGLSLEELATLELRSGGLCEICKTAEATCVDHCHESNRVRGLVCGPCNKGLGFFRDDPNVLNSASEYLLRYN